MLCGNTCFHGSLYVDFQLMTRGETREGRTGWKGAREGRGGEEWVRDRII